MRRYRTLVILGWLGLLFGLLTPPSLAITPYDDVLVQQAANNMRQENYDEALVQLTEAWQKGTHTPEKAFLLGQVNRLMLNYPEAQRYLEEALRLKPDDRPAQLMLADTFLALDRPQEALPLLRELEAAGFEPGQTAFLLGMAATKEGRPQDAVDYFRKAQTDPKVGQEAMFQSSLALAALNRHREAYQVMERSILLNPQSQTADFAQRYKGILAERAEEQRPFHITVSTGYDYDSNISLSPSAPGQVTVVSGQGGSVFSQAALLEYTLLPTGPFSILSQYSYFQNFHPTVTGFDIMSHYMGLTPTYGFAKGRFWLPLAYTFMDLQSDKYYTAFLLTPTYLHMLTEHVGLELGGKFNRQYFWTPVFFPQDDRSGKLWGGNMGLYYFFKNQKGYFQTRFTYEHIDTTGSNWANSNYRLLLSFLWPVTEKFKYNIFLDMMLQPYEHPFYNGVTVGNILGAPLVPNPKRFDKILIFGMQASYEFIKGLEAGIHWYYIRDDSNIALYDYNRHLVGCQFAYRY